jgi:aspartate-semialdehyde dehydrogenase
MKVAVVGATGLVGGVMLEVLEERNFPLTTLYAVASEKSVGKEVLFKGEKHKVIGMQTAVDNKPDLAIFSAGGGTSLEWAPKFAEAGCVVVDNSSAWRMDPTKRLVVPEINASVIGPNDRIIANPNCSTIQMVLPLAPLHKAYKIKRIVVSTYQSVTGTGIKAVRQMQDERAGVEGERAYPHPIDRNCLPHCDVFLENAYTKEEMKMVNETRKILQDDSIMVTATTVRVPVVGGHSESVNLEFGKDYEMDDIRRLLSETPGVVIQDDTANNIYPMPRYAEGKDDVFVGRIRRDESREKCLNLWIVSDNLRKGAATNAIQIAEYMVENKLV